MKHFSIIFALSAVNLVCGSLLKFYPLTPKQVYMALRGAGREDAIPEGRFITQGMAAWTGFAAGIATGIGVPLIFNIDLANVTGILGNSNTNSNTASNQLSMQEICFNSRSLNEINDDEVGRNEETEKSFDRNTKTKRFKVREGRKLREKREELTSTDPVIPETENVSTVTTSSPESTYDDSLKATPTTQTREVTDENDGSNIVESPSDTRKFLTNTGTTTDDGTGTGTNSVTTTQTGTGNAVNCVVIQKPTKR